MLTAQSETKNSSNDESIFTIVDEMPSFPGGEAAMVTFLKENLQYPKKEKEEHISGKCFLTFIIEKDGRLNQIKVLKGITGGPGCDDEAIRVLKRMPAWTPGKKNGEVVRVQYNLPIKFSLLSEEAEVLKDTTYITYDGKETSKEKASYYRFVSKRDEGYLVKDFYLKTNKIQMIAICNEIKPLKKNGSCTYFFQTGTKSSEGMYIKNKKAGKWTLWEEDNTDSSTIECFEDGTYKNIHLSKTRATPYNRYDAFYQIEELAEFPGGESEMQQWIAQKVKKRGYPAKEKKAGISGTCYVTFVIEKDGSITGIDLIRGVPNGPGYDQLVMEIVKEMPIWKPGKEYGNPVRVQFNLPVRFVLQ